MDGRWSCCIRAWEIEVLEGKWGSQGGGEVGRC